MKIWSGLSIATFTTWRFEVLLQARVDLASGNLKTFWSVPYVLLERVNNSCDDSQKLLLDMAWFIHIIIHACDVYFYVIVCCFVYFAGFIIWDDNKI